MALRLLYLTSLNVLGWITLLTRPEASRDHVCPHPLVRQLKVRNQRDDQDLLHQQRVDVFSELPESTAEPVVEKPCHIFAVSSSDWSAWTWVDYRPRARCAGQERGVPGSPVRGGPGTLIAPMGACAWLYGVVGQTPSVVSACPIVWSGLMVSQ